MTAYLDLFSGIGGFALGAYWAGLRFDAHYFSEVDPYAIRVYQQRFPDANPLGDIRGIKASDLPVSDWIIAGGFPCQDISVAGKGAGLAGTRSGLWYEYARLIGELRPRYAIMENVGTLAFRGLDAVLGSLAALGYDAEWQDIRASDVGAPHRRERIWIVGYPSGGGCSGITWGGAEAEPSDRYIQLEASDIPYTLGDGVRDEPRRSCGQDGPSAAEPSDDGKEGTLADSNEIERDRSGRARDGRTQSTDGGEALAYSPHKGNVRWDGELGATQEEMLGHRRSPQYGGREWWAVEPDVGRVAHGVPSRVDRLKCLGNSIVPQIAELIFKQEAFNEWRTA
jgi:DNA (cytosine-5)-methyltransferase 1